MSFFSKTKEKLFATKKRTLSKVWEKKETEKPIKLSPKDRHFPLRVLRKLLSGEVTMNFRGPSNEFIEIRDKTGKKSMLLTTIDLPPGGLSKMIRIGLEAKKPVSKNGISARIAQLTYDMEKQAFRDIVSSWITQKKRAGIPDIIDFTVKKETAPTEYELRGRKAKILEKITLPEAEPQKIRALPEAAGKTMHSPEKARTIDGIMQIANQIISGSTNPYLFESLEKEAKKAIKLCQNTYDSESAQKVKEVVNLLREKQKIEEKFPAIFLPIKKGQKEKMLPAHGNINISEEKQPTSRDKGAAEEELPSPNVYSQEKFEPRTWKEWEEEQRKPVKLQESGDVKLFIDKEGRFIIEAPPRKKQNKKDEIEWE